MFALQGGCLLCFFVVNNSVFAGGETPAIDTCWEEGSLHRSKAYAAPLQELSPVMVEPFSERQNP